MAPARAGVYRLMWRPVPTRPAHARVRPAILVLLALGSAVACNAEADLIAYFGRSPEPSASPAPTSVATASPTPATSGQPEPTATATADPTPTSQPTPTDGPSPADTPTATPAWSPMPTRPPGLATFADLRDGADVTDVSRLAANPGGLAGSSVYFEGRVNSVEESANGRVRARVKIGEVFVYLVYRTDRYWGDHPLVQGDRIRVVGEFIGMSSEGGERLPEIEPIDMVHRFT